MSSFHSLVVKDAKHQDFPLSDLKGKHVLVVNVASRCGYTPQYKGLQALYEKMKPKLEIIGVPCNQFGAQEPGTEEQILDFCSSKYNVSFPILEKQDVNGASESPLYQELKRQKPGQIKWNFEKFLVDSQGNVIDRFGSGTTPAQLESIISAKL
ncbi:thioredoxin-like protein [Hyaloraphidium curvatum]|nr:thioredoxin-like protein [Hyaloraphidium curvatum]